VETSIVWPSRRLDGRLVTEWDGEGPPGKGSPFNPTAKGSDGLQSPARSRQEPFTPVSVSRASGCASSGVWTPASRRTRCTRGWACAAVRKCAVRPAGGRARRGGRGEGPASDPGEHHR
jgi:hypothetical protein